MGNVAVSTMIPCIPCISTSKCKGSIEEATVPAYSDPQLEQLSLRVIQMGLVTLASQGRGPQNTGLPENDSTGKLVFKTEGQGQPVPATESGPDETKETKKEEKE